MAALPRGIQRLIFLSRVHHRSPINAHILMYAALSRSVCALPLNLI